MSTTRECECVRICSYGPISIDTRCITLPTHDCVVLDETEDEFSNFITERDRFSCVFPSLLFELFLELRKVLSSVLALVHGSVDHGMMLLTSDSCGKRVTNAINSSHPALRLMGFGERLLSSSAPSLRACTSSNIVPASDCPHLREIFGGYTRYRRTI